MSEFEKKLRRIDLPVLQAYGADLTVNYSELDLPEAVEEGYFTEPRLQQGPAKAGVPATLGSFRRRSIRSIVERTLPRLHRTRDDIEWLLVDSLPIDFAQFDVWVDPAVGANDFDGFVAEALVAGKIVVASRIPINVKRLEKGRTGILVPPNDPNELTHAILAALFKPEVAQQKIEAARQTISKFHPRQRVRALTQLLTATKR